MIDWTAAELAELAAGHQVTKGPDGGLRDREGPVSDGLACMLLAHESGTHPVSPGDYQRPYLRDGHAADSPVNTRVRATTIDPATGSRSTTPGVAKAVPQDPGALDACDFARGPLTADREAPSPGDQPGNNTMPAVTGSGHEMYQHAASAYNTNVAQARADQVMPSQACTSGPATARWSPSADMQASNVPQSCDPSSLTGRSPGER